MAEQLPRDLQLDFDILAGKAEVARFGKDFEDGEAGSSNRIADSSQFLLRQTRDRIAAQLAIAPGDDLSLILQSVQVVGADAVGQPEAIAKGREVDSRVRLKIT